MTFVGPSPDSYVGSLLLAGAAFFVIAIPLWRGLRDAYQTLLQDLTITDDDLRTLNRGNAAGIVSGLLATAGILAFFLAMGPAWRILGPGPPSIASIHSVESVIPETFLAGMGAVAATGFLMVGTYMILLPSLQARLVPLPLMWFVTYVSNSIAVAILDVGVRWSLLGDPLPSGSEWFGVLGLSLVGTIAGEHSLAPLEPHFSRIREDYIRCPTEGCGEQVNLRSDYCKSCGAEIPDERGEVLRSDNGLSEDPAP